MSESDKPIVVITGAAGGIGTALCDRLRDAYTVIGLDRDEAEAADEAILFDLASDDSVELALRKLRDSYGDRIDSFIHLAAYFDFTGEESPLYEAVNVEGTRRLLRHLQTLDVRQFVYSSTMLVHRPCVPGERIDETTPIEPKWAYPRSKARTEAVIREEHGKIPVIFLRLAGLYDDVSAVPTLSHQIARVFERDIKSHLYSGDLHAGQAMLHQEDMLDAFRRAVDRRSSLPAETSVLIGEPDAIGYGRLQDRIGCLIHGEEEWATLTLPKTLARMGARLEEVSEPLVPDFIDEGEKPFIRPFMISMADDHYALDVTRANSLLGWKPEHSIEAGLQRIVEALKRDPAAWYEINGITPPRWLHIAEEQGEDTAAIRASHEDRYRGEHRRNLWAHFVNAALGTWLLTAPDTLAYSTQAMVWNDRISGLAIVILALLCLSWRLGPVRWLTAAVGCWVMFAPLVFWTPSAAAYLNGTLVGALVTGLAVATRPVPGVSPVAAMTGPTVPPGWDFCPSSWFQRLPIILLAIVGFHISQYMTAYQLGHTGGIWDPFFTAGSGPKNGSEFITTSWVSEAWPVPDAGLGALTYMLEIITGLVGSSRRWRTMPWLVFLFGIMIVPLGVVSITFIVIQPILLGTWCTVCLIAAAAMLVQIPYSLDELVATGQFLVRRKRAGRSVIRIFFVGDTDEGRNEVVDDDFERGPLAIIREMASGGIGLPWTLLVSIALGVWLMFTRAVLGSDGGMADADHLIGSLVVTFSVAALAEVARPVRLLNIACGVSLVITPFVFGADLLAMLCSLGAGALLIGLALPRGEIRGRYGNWNRLIV